MAQSGSIIQTLTGFGYLKTTITAFGTAAGNSPPCNLRAYPFTSYVAWLNSGTAPTSVQAQGSNDGGNHWVNVGSTFTLATPAGGTLTPSQVPYELYQFLLVGGDGTTNIEIDIIGYGTRG
jgi:hypothetical protein